MFNVVVRILLKLLELIGCIACLITKNLTDAEARRVSIRNQKYSREWSLLNNVTWSREGNAFASVTYGGYTLITSLLLLSRCVQPSGRSTFTEKIFLVVGMIFFFVIGSIVYASLEQVPSELYDNAIILGSLSYLVALLFLIDLADPVVRKKSNYTQTESDSARIQAPREIDNVNSTKNVFPDDISFTSDTQNPHPSNRTYFPGDQVDIIQTKILPSPQKPVFQNILLPEKQRATKQKISEPTKSYKNQEIVTPEVLKKSDQSQNLNYYYLEEEPIYRSDARSFHVTPHQKHRGSGSRVEENYNHSRPGFVTQAAKMWDRKSKCCSANKALPKQKLNTIV